MAVRVTSTDLDDWSRRKDSDSHLPTLVRRLIMASSRPDSIRMPAAEGVALSGFDGAILVRGGADPFVPAGRSVWELGTNEKKRAKAVDDYEKRTKQTPADERARTTYVCVLSRRWGSGAAWVKEMVARDDGWRDIRVLAADELALWIESCPGVEAWFREHQGLGSLGDVGIGDWFRRWSTQSDPDTPAALLTAGRQRDVTRLLDRLDGAPSAVSVAAPSVDEAVAFIGAALLLGPDEVQKERHDHVETGSIDAPSGISYEPTSRGPEAEVKSRLPEHLEALRERTIVIEDRDGWIRWSSHASPHVLVPIFRPTSVRDAVDAGHHVVLPQLSRTDQQDGQLSPLDINAASSAWQAAGLDFHKAHDYATASRRNLGSLRRRLSRYGSAMPSWAEDRDASLLASVLLAGGWRSTHAGDQEVLEVLSGVSTWRKLSKSLVPLTAGADAPLSVLEDEWDFVDAIDAWDLLLPLMTAEDLAAFADASVKILTEPDPDADVVPEEAFTRLLAGSRSKRRYSGRLRRGVATTLAILGAVVNAQTVASQTGSAVSRAVVQELFADAGKERWRTLADVLQLLAEAAPEVLLDALDASLRDHDPPVMELFLEVKSLVGGTRASHVTLLWALETLAYSPALVSRVCVVLARLAVLDPGGGLANRPAASLVGVLNAHSPAGAVQADNRLQVLDAVLAAVPEHADELLKSLIQSDGGGIVSPGPRYRDWPVPRGGSTTAEAAHTLTELCARLLLGSTSSLRIAASEIARFSNEDVGRVLEALGDRWSEFEESDVAHIVASLESTLDEHRRFGSSWSALPPDQLARMDKFLQDHGVAPTATDAFALFSYDPERGDLEAEGDAHDAAIESLDERRRAVLLDLMVGGLSAVLEFAVHVDVPAQVGVTLAETGEPVDDLVLDLLNTAEPDGSPTARLCQGFVARRTVEAGWLKDQITSRPAQAATILLAARLDEEVLSLLDTTTTEERLEFWSRVTPYGVDVAIVEAVATGLLEVRRPFTAIIAVGIALRREAQPPSGLIIRVLDAAMTETAETPTIGFESLGQIVARLLDQLEGMGTSDDVLARFEFFYLPLIDRFRSPRAAHRELARRPELFADAVAACYKADNEPTPSAKSSDDVPARSSEQKRMSEAFFRLLRSWNGPLPGTVDDNPPTADRLARWVSEARIELRKRDRASLASMAIGSTLAAPVTDPDGTWPCESVRLLLEREEDEVLESHLETRLYNQQGVRGRPVYSGGAGERTLAEQYRDRAAKVVDRWPRTGALLARIASGYDQDARWIDRRAEREARGN